MKKTLKKSLISVLGTTFLLMGLVFIIIPGPSFLFILPGLLILSYEYPIAKIWLRKYMKLMQRAANWLDQSLRARRYN